jgi:hypothetical protein
MAKKKETMFDKYKDRGHLLQKHNQSKVKKRNRAHLMQCAQSPEDVKLTDRGHYLQRNG